MKYISVLLLIMVGIHANAQIVYNSKFSKDAQLKVAVVKFVSDADLIVYQTKYKSEVGNNNGIWYFSQFGSDAHKKIFITPFSTDADLKIFYTKFSSKAGWQNKAKMKLME
ncbi:MAG: hypothetical protein RJA07_2840 [Bacteroidota bacterium]|jgi:hypothetical protein